MNKYDDKYIEMMQYLEWKEKVDDINKKFDEANKRRKGNGVL